MRETPQKYWKKALYKRTKELHIEEKRREKPPEIPKKNGISKKRIADIFSRFSVR